MPSIDVNSSPFNINCKNIQQHIRSPTEDFKQSRNKLIYRDSHNHLRPNNYSIINTEICESPISPQINNNTKTPTKMSPISVEPQAKNNNNNPIDHKKLLNEPSLHPIVNDVILE